LRDADAGDDPGSADGAGTLADLDGVCAGIGQEFHAFGAGYITRDQAEIRKGFSEHSHRLADTFGKAMGGGYGNGVDTLVDQIADVPEDAVAVERTVLLAVGGDGGAADEAEMRVAGGLDRLLLLGLDSLDVGQGEESAQAVLVVDHEQLVNAEVLGEEFVRGLNRVLRNVAFLERVDLIARRHRLGDGTAGVAGFYDPSGEEAEQLVGFVHYGEGAEAEAAVGDQIDDFADALVRADLDWFLDEAVDVVLHAGHFLDLFLVGHVVVDQAHAAVERHLDGHFRLRHGVHVRGDDGNLQLEVLRKPGDQIRLAGEHLGIQRGQRNVVVGQADGQVAGEETVGGLVIVFDPGRGGRFHGLNPAKDCLFSSRNDVGGSVNCSVEYRPYRRPFRHPLRTARGIWTVREGFLVKVVTAEGVGYGEIAPIPSFGSETTEAAETFLRKCISAPDKHLARLPVGLPCSAFALSSALAVSKSTFNFSREVAGLLPAGEAALSALREKSEQGFRVFKWKIGVFEADEELAVMEELFSQLPSDGRLRFDANGGLDRETSGRWLERLAPHQKRVEYLEQPLPVGEETAMAELGGTFGIPVALDESLNGPVGRRWLVPGAWDGPLVVKPALMGDVRALAATLAPVAEQVVLSSVFETGVGLANALALLDQLPDIGRAIGFDTAGMFFDFLSPVMPSACVDTAMLASYEPSALWKHLPPSN